MDHPPPGPLADALGFLLSWNGQRIARKFAAAMDELGLRPPHFGVMRLLDAAPGRTQQELVEGALIDPSSMVKVIDELEQMGIAERRIHPDDRRKRVVYLTPAGHKTLAKALKVANGVADEVFGPLDAKERETLHALLRKLAGVGS
jgi:MarR family transcriptional regulator, lower aerobic nicotinate degradation pathway regulator